MAPDVALVPGARHAVAPAGIESTAWPRVERTCQNIGWRFDPWQVAVGRLILAKKAGGAWAADLSVLSIPRQVGKSYLLGCIIFALCLLTPKTRVIWTSHHTATTEEMFDAMKELAAHKRVAPHVVKCIALQGSRWRIVFANGSRIDFGSRERGFGRGKSKVDVIVFDELQHITMRALANLSPTTSAASNPLILGAGTPPAPTDNGEAFRQRRKAAIEAMSDDTLYVEFSADPDADLDDRAQWAKANPSFPKRTKERAFLLNRKILDEENFRREFLGIWDADAVSEETIFGSPEVWSEARTTQVPDGVAALGLAMTADRSTLALVGASLVEFVPENDPEAEPTDLVLVAPIMQSSDFEAVVAEAKRIQVEHDCALLLDARGPASTLRDTLEAADISVDPADLSAIAAGCASFVDRLSVSPPTLRHLANAELDQAVLAAVWRWVGDLRVVGRRTRKGVVDVAMLEAAVLAVMGAESGSTFNIF
ncbi:MAG: hypothetical protein NVSMB48_26540 [Marmoricola sp.]